MPSLSIPIRPVRIAHHWGSSVKASHGSPWRYIGGSATGGAA
jgi:hypothetical protein